MKELVCNKEKEISRIETEELLPTIKKSLIEIMPYIANFQNQIKELIQNGTMLELITLTNSISKFISSIKINSEETQTRPRLKDKHCWIKLLRQIRNSKLKEKTTTIKNENNEIKLKKLKK